MARDYCTGQRSSKPEISAMIPLLLTTPRWSISDLPVNGASSSYISPRVGSFPFSETPYCMKRRSIMGHVTFSFVLSQPTHIAMCWPVSPSGCSLFRTRVQSSCWTCREYPAPAQRLLMSACQKEKKEPKRFRLRKWSRWTLKCKGQLLAPQKGVQENSAPPSLLLFFFSPSPPCINQGPALIHQE